MKHLEHFHELKSLTRKQKFFLLSLLPVYFMVIGLFLQPIQEIGPGIVRLIKEPDFLITDYFVVGGVGAALINAGALTLMSIGIIYFMGMDMDGHTITSSCLMFGFSLFGKNLLNIWAILAGVYLYAKYHKTSMKRFVRVRVVSWMFYFLCLSSDCQNQRKTFTALQFGCRYMVLQHRQIRLSSATIHRRCSL